MNVEQMLALRERFPDSMVGKLPKAGMQLDYVGHAAVTDRLLSVDPEWSWEPMAYAEDGGPLVRYGAKEATLWIRLTVCGVTRPGVGSAPVGAFDIEKQLVSDALRNAAMRFGVALDLWSKEDLQVSTENAEAVKQHQQMTAQKKRLAAACGGDKALARRLWGNHTDPVSDDELDEMCLRAEQEQAGDPS